MGTAKITKESVTSAPTQKEDVKNTPPKIERAEIANPVTSPSSEDTAKLKESLRKELLDEVGAEEVVVLRTTCVGSREAAERLNNAPKELSMWELDMGEKQGMIEEVTINGAVAQIPKGVPVLVPVQIKKLIEKYQVAEKTAGDNIVNLQGGTGLKLDRDNEASNMLS